MDDRFLFRAFHAGEMFHFQLGDLICVKQEKIYPPIKKQKDFLTPPQEETTVPILESDCVVMQCTGLKDKNGTLIYGSDMVKYDFVKGDFIGTIEFLLNNQKTVICKNGLPESDLDHLTCKHIEVIGNIYENPGLLEVK